MLKKSAPTLSENDLVRFLQDRFGKRCAGLIQGIGDDAAVVLPSGAREYWIITSDMILEQVDFRLEWTTAQEIGHKALAVNLSDIAAMGGRPRYYTVALGIPSGTPRKWIGDLYRGMTALGASAGAALIGGDLSRADSIQITITLIGETLDRRVLYRAGARAGDRLYVTGTLGKAAAGLKLVMAGDGRPAGRYQREAIRAWRMPEPRSEAGLWLAQSGLVTGMMDLSDGLSVDLPRMCQAARAGAEIQDAALPLFSKSADWGCDPLELALHGGEDFELLFSVPARKAALLEKSYPSSLPKVTSIGRLTGTHPNVLICRSGHPPEPLPAGGFDHFRPAEEVQ